MKRSVFSSGLMTLIMVSICLTPLFPFFQDEAKSIQIEISAPKLTVFDIACQVIIQQGYSLLSTNDRVGLITTDYKVAKESFGSSLLLSLAGRKDTEIMITASITEANGKSSITLFPKARIKKFNRITTEGYEEFKLSNKTVESFKPLLEKIKALAEQGAGAAVSAPVANTKPEAAKPTTIVPPPAPLAQQPKQAPKFIETSFIKVKVVAANIRKSPSLQGTIIKSSSQGNEYKVIGIEGDWYEILFDDHNTGYINKSVVDQFLKPVEQKEEPPSVESKPAKAVSVVSEEKDTGKNNLPGKPVKIPEGSSSQLAGSEKDFLFCVGGGLALAMGYWNSLENKGAGYTTGFGIDLHALMHVIDRLYIGGYLGGYFFSGSDTNLSRIQLSLEFQYRYPLSEKIWVFGGLGLGPAVDTINSHGSVAFATDLLLGIRYGAFYLNPRFRIISHEIGGYSSFDLTIGYIF